MALLLEVPLESTAGTKATRKSGRGHLNPGMGGGRRSGPRPRTIIVEAGGGEGGDGGVHAALDGEEVGGDARVDKAIEEGGSKVVHGGQVGGDRGGEPTVVTNKGKLLAAARKDDGGC